MDHPTDACPWVRKKFLCAYGVISLLLNGFLSTYPIPAIGVEDKTPYIPIGQAKTRKIRVIIATPQLKSFPGTRSVVATAPSTPSEALTPTNTIVANTPESRAWKKIQATLSADLKFMDNFELVNKEIQIPPPTASDSPADAPTNLPSAIPTAPNLDLGADYLLSTDLSLSPNQALNSLSGPLELQARILELPTYRVLLTRKYVARPEERELKVLAHTLGNDFVRTTTHLPGIFLTQIAMSCDGGGKKEIYLTNIDGSETRQLTHHHSLAFSPAWHPSGKKLAYSLYTRHADNEKNIDLFEMDLASNTVKLLSSEIGINSGAVYVPPKGDSMVLTLSVSGYPSLHQLDLLTQRKTLITESSAGVNVDPDVKADASTVAFVSSRSGASMIYRVDLDKSNLKRLTYAGKYNATPTWAHLSDSLAFAGWLDRHFDLFSMNADGSHLARLTQSQGNNEDPHFSPDDNFLVFSSNRTGQKNIYVMNVDGSFARRITYGLGNCVSPKWSPVKAEG